ncbi:hypothetical protein GCM10009116_13390 [Brevundimonas basaltis]|uniref:Uncharacterized protein n=1 Tax=Brevundimonas basaltis TaxID=472166 RepID=A0A7W8HWS3_9CAUL|nr:hypothetical protein [Brevundimonas basaltis]MBB5291348.1 hypothetical protein [Brevundimonas basaltis]
MKTLLIAIAGLGALALTTPAQAGGVAVCIEVGSNATGGGDDKQYFIRRSPSINSRTLERQAREDFDNRRYGGSNNWAPHCDRSRSMEHGQYVLILGGRRLDYAGAPYTRWALGYGANRTAAKREAVRQLRLRDGGYQDRHGYSVVESGSF